VDQQDYELGEPVGYRHERFNWWAALLTYLWAASHGMWRWAFGLYAAYLGLELLAVWLLMALNATGAAGPVGIILGLAVSYWFGIRANRLLWQHDRERFYAANRERSGKPLSTRERIIVTSLFAPFALVFAALMLGLLLGYL